MRERMAITCLALAAIGVILAMAGLDVGDAPYIYTAAVFVILAMGNV